MAVTLGAILLVTLMGGCTSRASRIRDARAAFYHGDLERTVAILDTAGRGHPDDKDCATLDQAMVSLVSGQTQEAEQLLRDVRDRFEFLEQQHLGEEGLALLADDTKRSYAGEDYEKVLIRAFLVVANLMHGGHDATAYSLQLNQAQREMADGGAPTGEESPQRTIRPVAVGKYLHGVLQEATHQSYDGAERSYAAVAAWEPGFALAKLDLERARAGVHSASGNGVVYVITLVGRGPYKEEATAPATSNSLLIADRILSAAGKHSLPPTVAPVRIPRIVATPSPIDAIEVQVNGQVAGVTQTVTDVTQLAIDQEQANLPHTIARAIARRSLKKTAIYGSKDVLGIEDPWSSLAMDLAGVLWEASESADTRGWALLPDRIQILRVELPKGVHRLALRAITQGRPLSPPRPCDVTVDDGRNNYLLAYFPDGQLVGRIVNSQPN